MARSVSALFAEREHVDSAVGALRDDGFGAERISIVSPDGTAINVEPEQAARHGLGPWLVDHLLRHGHPRETARQLHDQVVGGRWLVTVAVASDAEDGSARNLLVAAGADEISSVAGGAMVHIPRQGEQERGHS